MDFDFSDEQEQLRDAVRKWVDKAYSFDERRSVVAAGGFSASAYQAMRLGRPTFWRWCWFFGVFINRSGWA
jgi:hypothetical protein